MYSNSTVAHLGTSLSVIMLTLSFLHNSRVENGYFVVYQTAIM